MLILYWIFFSQSFSIAQEESPCKSVEDEKATELFTKASDLPDDKKDQAYKLLLEAVKIEPEYAEAYYIMADINLMKANEFGEVGNGRQYDIYYNRALKYYEKVHSLCPAYDHFFTSYFFGKKYFNEHNYDKALTLLNTFVEKNQTQNKEVKEAKTMIEKITVYQNLVNNPVPFNPVVVTGVSSKFDEFLPLISPDNELFFFTRRSMRVDYNTSIQKEFEEFMVSIQDQTDKTGISYHDGKAMQRPFNTEANQGGVSITIDNNHLYITRCDAVYIDNKYYNNCDIFESKYQFRDWTELKRLGSNINGRNTWESQPSISSDGKVLYFASARPEGFGGVDIYYSVLQADSTWGKAQNLGKSINTEGDDQSPFIHTDSKTLYFSSNGRSGVGGFDIFYSRQIDENKWTEPKNIGYPINTEDDDLGFVVSTDGKKAYFSSNKIKQNSGWDIYSFDLYEEAKPEKVIFVKGQLIDDKGQALTNAKVELTNINTKNSTEALVDQLTGKYAVAVQAEPKEEFIMTVRKQEYTFSSQVVDEETFKDENIPNIDVELKPIELGTSFQISNILFATNSAEFDEASKIILGNLFKFLNDNPKIKVAVNGHTDNIGDDTSNLLLSKRRSQAVVDYLIGLGIKPERLEASGFGETQPIASNDNEDGRKQNRRTEFIILEL